MPQYTFKFKTRKDAKTAIKSIKWATKRAKKITLKKIGKNYSVSYTIPKRR